MAGQLYDVADRGGYLSVPTLAKKIHWKTTPLIKTAQFIQAEPTSGIHKGNTFYFDKIASDLDETPTATSDLLNEDSPIPPGEYTISQAQAVLNEFGKQVPLTGKVVTLSQIEITPQVEQILERRYMKVMDAVHALGMKQGHIWYSPLTAASGTLTASAASVTAADLVSGKSFSILPPRSGATYALANLNAWHVREIVDYLKGNNVPPYFADSDEYACLITTKALRGLYDDPDFEKVQLYGQPQARLKGEAASYYHCRFVETTHAQALTNGVGSSSVLGEALFFGQEVAIHHYAVAPEIRIRKADFDYGRQPGIAWYGIFTTDPIWQYDIDGEARAVYVTSATASS